MRPLHLTRGEKIYFRNGTPQTPIQKDVNFDRIGRILKSPFNPEAGINTSHIKVNSTNSPSNLDSKIHHNNFNQQHWAKNRGQLWRNCRRMPLCWMIEDL